MRAARRDRSRYRWRSPARSAVRGLVVLAGAKNKSGRDSDLAAFSGSRARDTRGREIRAEIDAEEIRWRL